MMKNLKLGPKLIVSFLLVAVIASISGIVTTVLMRSIDKRYSDALVNYGFSQGDLGKALAQFSLIDGYVHDAISYIDRNDGHAAKNEIGQAVKDMEALFSTIEGDIQTEENRKVFATAKNSWTKYQETFARLLADGDTTDVSKVMAAQKKLMTDLDPIYDEVYSSLENLLDNKIALGSKENVTLTQLVLYSILFAWLVVLASFIISGLLGMRIAKGIARPIQACSARLAALSQGDLESVVPAADTKDEVGILANATQEIVLGLRNIVDDVIMLLEKMGDGNFAVKTSVEKNYVGDFEPLLKAMRKINIRLSDTMRSINEASEQVSGGAEQVSSGAQALSQGATEQASSIEELAATINEISDRVKTSSDNAQTASGMVNTVANEMTESNKQMQTMMQAMADISGSSNEIGKIIKTIEDIAFQTNILALNAAVEAARAGAAGKGFAVVADEVRNLASKSAEASKNTSALIENSLRVVETGRQIADATAKSLLMAVEGTKSVTGIVHKISKASEEQASALAQVTVGIDQISSVVQTNSATAEESAAASEELSGQAQMLRELVSRFRLRNTSAGAGRQAKEYSVPAKKPVQSAEKY